MDEKLREIEKLYGDDLVDQLYSDWRMSIQKLIREFTKKNGQSVDSLRQEARTLSIKINGVDLESIYPVQASTSIPDITSDLNDEISRLDNRLKEIEADVKKLEQRKNDLLTKVDKYRKSIENLEEQLKKIDKNIFPDEYLKYETSLNYYKSLIDEYQNELILIENSINVLNSERTDIDAKKNNIQDTLNSLSNTHPSLNIDFERFNADQYRLTEITKLIEEYDSEMSRYRSAIDSIGSISSHTSNAVEIAITLSEMISTNVLETDLADLTRQLEALRDRTNYDIDTQSDFILNDNSYKKNYVVDPASYIFDQIAILENKIRELQNTEFITEDEKEEASNQIGLLYDEINKWNKTLSDIRIQGYSGQTMYNSALRNQDIKKMRDIKSKMDAIQDRIDRLNKIKQLSQEIATQYTSAGAEVSIDGQTDTNSLVVDDQAESDFTEIIGNITSLSDEQQGADSSVQDNPDEIDDEKYQRIVEFVKEKGHVYLKDLMDEFYLSKVQADQIIERLKKDKIVDKFCDVIKQEKQNSNPDEFFSEEVLADEQKPVLPVQDNSTEISDEIYKKIVIYVEKELKNKENISDVDFASEFGLTIEQAASVVKRLKTDKIIDDDGCIISEKDEEVDSAPIEHVEYPSVLDISSRDDIVEDDHKLSWEQLDKETQDMLIKYFNIKREYKTIEEKDKKLLDEIGKIRANKYLSDADRKRKIKELTDRREKFRSRYINTLTPSINKLENNFRKMGIVPDDYEEDVNIILDQRQSEEESDEVLSFSQDNYSDESKCEEEEYVEELDDEEYDDEEYDEEYFVETTDPSIVSNIKKLSSLLFNYALDQFGKLKVPFTDVTFDEHREQYWEWREGLAREKAERDEEYVVETTEDSTLSNIKYLARFTFKFALDQWKKKHVPFTGKTNEELLEQFLASRERHKKEKEGYDDETKERRK